MYMSEKTGRVIWQVTDTTGVPILGSTQVKLYNYISYPKIHPPQEQSPVSQNSQVCRLCSQSNKDYKPQSTSTKTAQSADSL